MRQLLVPLVRRFFGCLLAAASLWAVTPVAVAADFSVRSPGFFYSFNGTGNNPTITLVRGRTYSFEVNTTLDHPFAIDAPLGTVTGNDTSSGTVLFAVPLEETSYFYFCSIHGFGGTILTVPAPAPPTIQILSLAVSSNLVLTSTGTNTWSVLPEFNTNLTTTNWFALTVQTNRFENGTNETICGLPNASNVFVRIRSLPQ